MSAKEAVLEMIRKMPENSTIDDIAHRIEFLAAIQKGLGQIENGEVISHEQVKKELASWLLK